MNCVDMKKNDDISEDVASSFRVESNYFLDLKEEAAVSADTLAVPSFSSLERSECSTENSASSETDNFASKLIVLNEKRRLIYGTDIHNL
jgi:hypothetical protein